MIIKYKDKIPYIAKGVKILTGAIIIGDVEIEENVSIWFNSVIRGDYEK